MRKYEPFTHGKGGQITRMAYTSMKVLGVDVNSWGTKSNQASKEISEMLV